MLSNGFFASRTGGMSADPAPTIEASVHAAQLKEALVCEMHAAALMTATLTSGANALTDKGVGIGPEELRAVAPGDLAQLATLADLLLETDLTTLDEPIFLGEFLAGACTGNELLSHYLRDAEAIGARRAGVLHKTALSVAWRQISHLAILALKELDAHIAPDLPEIYVQNSRVLTALLTGAKNGWRPCIDACGTLRLPPLPQQRRWPRRALLQDCKVYHREKRIDAFARDISAGGLGLDRMPPMTRGELIDVELVCGRRLKGIVAWSSGGSTGLRFPGQLKPTDPLLAA